MMIAKNGDGVKGGGGGRWSALSAAAFRGAIDRWVDRHVSF